MHPNEPKAMIKIFCINQFGLVPPKSTAETWVGTMNPSQKNPARPYTFQSLGRPFINKAKTTEVTIVKTNCATKRGAIFLVITFCSSGVALSKPWILPHTFPNIGMYHIAPKINCATAATSTATKFMFII